MPSQDPRERFAIIFPQWLQPALTWLSGKALPNQKPLMRCTPVTKLVVTALTAAVGLGLCIDASLFFLTSIGV